MYYLNTFEFSITYKLFNNYYLNIRYKLSSYYYWYDCFPQEKRLSGLSNQSHDSQASSSTTSATSQDEKRGINSTGMELNNGQGQEEEELDEMEVEYSEVSCIIIVHVCECLSMFNTSCI